VDGCAEGGKSETAGGVRKEFVTDLYGAPTVDLWSIDGGVQSVRVMRQ
jgi:hypothetical protein